MTGLLVSVRNVREARDALAGGADVIDVKEPSRGALGAADPDVWRRVHAVVAGRVPMSVAVGELTNSSRAWQTGWMEGFSFAKVGLAGCARSRDWPQRWAWLVQRFPKPLVAVGVVYADWQAAEAPAPEQVIDHAARLRCGAILIDTHDKTHGDLTTHCSVDELSGLVGRARDRNMRMVLAGSLTARSIARLMPLQPDYFAVRGAVCAGARTDAMDRSRVRALAALVHDRLAGCRR